MDDVTHRTREVLAYLVTGGFFAILLALILKGIPKDTSTDDVVLVLLGALATGWAQMMGAIFRSDKKPEPTP